jgi:hypothetical protein
MDGWLRLASGWILLGEVDCGEYLLRLQEMGEFRCTTLGCKRPGLNSQSGSQKVLLRLPDQKRIEVRNMDRNEARNRFVGIP